ncbi:hypothetical protein H0H93_015185 [Arthromyces matolae]|nr:hypothetical protein H0H93_015185 [Arthromyces matolae]
MADTEGSGMGRCTTILMGGRSGGHQAAVLNALDRLVKIWHLPEPMQGTLIREDKPLFSSSRIHKARVLSISWYDIQTTCRVPI